MTVAGHIYKQNHFKLIQMVTEMYAVNQTYPLLLVQNKQIIFSKTNQIFYANSKQTKSY